MLKTTAMVLNGLVLSTNACRELQRAFLREKVTSKLIGWQKHKNKMQIKGKETSLK